MGNTPDILFFFDQLFSRSWTMVYLVYRYMASSILRNLQTSQIYTIWSICFIILSIYRSFHAIQSCKLKLWLNYVWIFDGDGECQKKDEINALIQQRHTKWIFEYWILAFIWRYLKFVQHQWLIYKRFFISSILVPLFGNTMQVDAKPL